METKKHAIIVGIGGVTCLFYRPCRGGAYHYFLKATQWVNGIGGSGISGGKLPNWLIRDLAHSNVSDKVYNMFRYLGDLERGKAYLEYFGSVMKLLIHTTRHGKNFLKTVPQGLTPAARKLLNIILGRSSIFLDE